MSGQERDRTTPSNTELAEQVARIEGNVEQVDQKLDHQSEILERIEENVNDDIDANADRLDTIEDQHDTLWTVYSGAKWTIMYLSGGGVIALLVSLVIGAI